MSDPAFTRNRGRLVTLEWPVVFDGRTFEAILLKRLTAREVATFMKAVGAASPDESFAWPIFFAPDGEPLPDGLLDALDDDDRLALDKAALDFLPRRFRGAETSASAPAA